MNTTAGFEMAARIEIRAVTAANVGVRKQHTTKMELNKGEAEEGREKKPKKSKKTEMAITAPAEKMELKTRDDKRRREDRRSILVSFHSCLKNRFLPFKTQWGLQRDFALIVQTPSLLTLGSLSKVRAVWGYEMAKRRRGKPGRDGNLCFHSTFTHQLLFPSPFWSSI
jgi:hypothetical protein